MRIIGPTGFCTCGPYPSGVTFALTGGPVYAYDPTTSRWSAHDALVVEGGRIASLDARTIGTGVPIVDLEGGAVVPAFADAHVHLTETGRFLGERDLSAVGGREAFGRRIAALPRGPFVYAGNLDDAAWSDGPADAAPLDAYHPDAVAIVTRVDAHSSLVNRRALAFLDLDPATPGIERDAGGTPSGRLTLAANWLAQTRVLDALPAPEKRAAERRATALALAAGALHLHVQLVGLGARDAYAAALAALAAAGEAKWYPKICERDPALAASFGLPYVGGDVFLDGSIGSGTAALDAPYADRPGRGELALDDAAVETYFAAAEALGVSAGVHAIGDRAIEQLLSAWERVLGGRPSRRCRHFVEHFEIARPDQIARAARLGLFLSMQPQFDAQWGGAGGMYERRLGATRARGMNALASARRAGATLVGGDDSPVCRLAPLAGMQAALEHHNGDERLGAGDALAMYTWNAAVFGHAEAHTGRLAAGLAADLVVLDGDPLARGTFANVNVRQTWRDGRRVA